MNIQVIISEYRTEWQQEYDTERVKIQSALQDICVEIEHIGSTSVPGLGAKPIIDIMAGVRELEHVGQAHIDRLAAIDFKYVPKQEFPERLFFRRGLWRAGTHHLHIYRHESDQWNNQLLFRDYMRSHPEAVKEYYDLKKHLEQKYQHDRRLYTDAKSSFIESIIQQAQQLERMKITTN